jgi:predicted Kef-type K+ transport protein
MKPRAIWLFYAIWMMVCLLSFANSTLFGFITIGLGIALRLLEQAVELLRDLLIEQRLMRLEFRTQRLNPRDDRGD